MGVDLCTRNERRLENSVRLDNILITFESLDLGTPEGELVLKWLKQ